MEEGNITLLDLPTDVWTHVLENLVVYDTILLQTTCKLLLKISSSKLSTSKQPREDLMQYFAALGSIPCLEYLRDIGHEWDARTIAAAALEGHVEVIKFLKDNGCEFDEHACAQAARGGHFECLKYLHENGFPWDSSAPVCAAEADNLEILKYLHQSGCEWNASVLRSAIHHSLSCLKYALDNNCNAERVANRLCSEAASVGNMACLKYLFEAGYSKSQSCERAALGGHLECLKYAHENGGEWGETIADAAHNGHISCIKYAIENGDTTHVNPDMRISPLENAVRSGSVECVKLLHEHGCKWTGEEYDLAADRGDLQMVKYLLESGCPKPTTNIACWNAAGNLELLKYLHENGFRWDYTIDEANEYASPQKLALNVVNLQSIPCLKYIIACGYKIDTSDLSLCNSAVQNDNVAMLDYLMKLGCKCETGLMSYATQKGALNVLKYLHENGFEWDDNVPLLAAEYGYSDVLEYALANGCGYSSLVYSVAAERGHLQCIKIAHKYGVPCTANACLSAARSGQETNDFFFFSSSHPRLKSSKKSNSARTRLENLRCLKYLHENGCPWTHQECTEAAKARDLEVLKYLHENGSKWSEETWYAAVESDAINCLKYLYDNGCPQDLRTYTMMHSKKCYEFLQSITNSNQTDCVGSDVPQNDLSLNNNTSEWKYV